MFKHFFYLAVLSAIVVYFIKESAAVVHAVAYAHSYVAYKLAYVFKGAGVGKIIREALALFIIPIIVGFIPAGVYWLIERKKMPHTATLIWILWVVLAVTLIK